MCVFGLGEMTNVGVFVRDRGFFVIFFFFDVTIIAHGGVVTEFRGPDSGESAATLPMLLEIR